MAKNNENEQQKQPPAPFEAPKGDAPAPEFVSTNVSNQNLDAQPLGPGSPVTKTAQPRESIRVAAPTEQVSNQVQVKYGRYRKNGVLFNANGKEIDENGNVLED